MRCFCCFCCWGCWGWVFGSQTRREYVPIGSKLASLPATVCSANTQHQRAPDSRLQTPDSRLQTPDSRLSALGSRLSALGSQLPAPSSQLPAPSSQRLTNKALTTQVTPSVVTVSCPLSTHRWLVLLDALHELPKPPTTGRDAYLQPQTLLAHWWHSRLVHLHWLVHNLAEI